MNITLSPDLERLIAEKVESGQYASADEVIRESLELLQAKDATTAANPSTSDGDIAEAFRRIAAEVPADAWNDVPSDLSKNLDHYLYGSSKSE